MPSNQLQAAAVEVDITPPVGTPMEGYAARKGVSLGIHDPLLGQLLLLKAGEKRLVLISLDLLGVNLDFTQQVRMGIQQAIGAPLEGTLIACSHTHSGAAGFLPPHPGISLPQAPDLQQMTARKLIGAAIWAEQRLQPARLGIGRGSVAGIALNRNDPEKGLVDNELVLLSVEDVRGNPLAVVMNHGCHPTVLGYDNLYFSADYPGAARMTLRRIYPETTFLFTNGASGDISTRFTRCEQTYREVDRMGRLLAGEVLKVMQAIKTQPDVELNAKTVEVDLRFRSFPPVEVARQEKERLQAELEAMREAGAAHGAIRRAITRLEGANGQLLMAQELAGRTSNRSQMQALTVNELGMIGVPGEPFTRTVLDIKAASPKAATIVISYANDYQGYFPDAISIQEGSYEALISPYPAQVAESLAETALKLLSHEQSV